MSNGGMQSALTSAVLRLLKPLVRILLRHGVAFGGFSELVKRAYVEVAFEGFDVKGRKQTDSRVATLTGLSRKEVKRIKELPEEHDSESIVRYNRAARVVFGWVHDERYQRQDRESLDLAFDGAETSFSSLVKEYSGDVPPRAILDELLQVGVVSRDANGNIHLLKRAYIPSAGKIDLMAYLGVDVGGLLATMDHNIHELGPEPYFQRKVYYDNIPEETLVQLRAMVRDKGQPILEEFDKWLAQHDRDVNPKIKGTGRKGAGIGIYYFENDEDEEPRS